ncbi:MAG: preprotein translocase subunit SecA [Candidatus Lloydbacteria bacterium RIFCSPHIGHO2_02_FULL_54_17]|uniref:Protein translocase subunit SecA n=1 Tax=Candidatus Lloydbacteria bacterium RIFCSPHIGHO2_02_FULL_54_17 TaxID=1798664 RepID=A0A1G2DCG7_9BACT|nr:MAG: preprotein translocase subunit SecA [Candidatus Lloydbacteria bacterium RIFCSPHIGHO2_01_FULL_54_11]OGZ11324.1 MAG: preprotein translocase subunit SecA [Candidatus Lloydbacteria bacterium RIFCSPHIGHO2_02_FULL_54_17]OGZ13813.1 MAG: preprotein translocase subunit SecA [Candidatus Lloydbacteria bacterium RIFCSPLOWO2_01_FULL_54_18]OGZ15533.1 MAG: preprotein translocase subunit SecA [Candidatus Lloydbacteria bacterium RIFCSPLOWO2_02_FULL_54_12]
MDFLKKLFDNTGEKVLKKLEPDIVAINLLEPELAKLSDPELKERTAKLRARLAEGETLDDVLHEAFALVREASRRTLGQRHYDVQLLGGIILHRGGIAEMRTGEGKTLVATLPVFLNALEGKGVHVVTVNDYLSRRDAVWMGQIYSFLGLSVGAINHDASYLYDPAQKAHDLERDETGSFRVFYEFLRPSTRREAYAADITYGTNNEFGFDYLRDNISYEAKDLRQRESGHNYAIVDEVDSILIDEARTPLIISAPAQDSESLYGTFAQIARKMEESEDYTIDEKLKAIQITDAGVTKAEKLLGIENIYTEKGTKYVHHLETAVRAKALFIKDREYVVKDDGVVIVDEFTGRLQPGRRWSEGLHQAIEAKEGVKVEQESRTMASITFQNYFKLYKKLAGMTGTALTSSEEFFKIYGLEVTPIPPNRPSARLDQNDLIFQSEEGKFTAIAQKVKELHEKEQPVLIGTVSIEKNELLSAFLAREGVPHEVLNAKNHEREGEIIAQAGRRGSVVIATNMAGRGVDIKLGGNPGTKEDYDAVKQAGGLFVMGTERHDARRIDNQLRGRSGRQGDPGETQFYVSLEDSLMRIFASDTIKNLMGRFGIPHDQPIENKMITKALENAQTKIEGFNFDARKHVLQYDNIINLHRQTMYARRRKLLLGTEEEVDEYLAGLVAGAGETSEEVQKHIDEKIAAIGKKAFYDVIRRLALQTNDMFWVDHLELMDYARSSVNLRAYGQRDPLVEYKREALRLYREMEETIVGQILGMVPRIQVSAFVAAEAELKKVESQMTLAGGGADTSHQSSVISHQRDGKKEPGRNDPCWCGSGKKFKRCHGQ